MLCLRRLSLLLLGAVVGLMPAGCDDAMRDQGRLKPLEPHPEFAFHQSARPVPAGTVPRRNVNRTTGLPIADGDPQQDEAQPVGMPPLDKGKLLRGQERFTIFCAPCHGALGYGEGMIVLRGFPQPPSYHTDRLRSAPDAHFFDVITNGFGQMYPYATQVPEPDRWLIIAYIRALQRSQNSTLSDVPPELRENLQEMSP